MLTDRETTMMRPLIVVVVALVLCGCGDVFEVGDLGAGGGGPSASSGSVGHPLTSGPTASSSGVGGSASSSSGTAGSGGASCAPGEAPQADPRNCGACGHDCLGGACEAGRCQPFVVAGNRPGPLGLALDATHVYWTEATAVMRVAKSGGAPETVALGQGGPYGVAVDGGAVYWTNHSTGEVMKAAGGHVQTLVSGQASPLEIAVWGGNVYWTGGSGEVSAVAEDGTGQTTIASGQGSPHGIAVDASGIYWTNQTGGQVMRSTASGASVVAKGTAPCGLALVTGELYWTDALSGAGIVWGGGTVLATAQESPYAIAANAQGVFWLNRGLSGTDGRVLGLSNGGVSVLAKNQNVLTAVAAAADGVYWTTIDSVAAVAR